MIKNMAEEGPMEEQICSFGPAFVIVQYISALSSICFLPLRFITDKCVRQHKQMDVASANQDLLVTFSLTLLSTLPGRRQPP